MMRMTMAIPAMAASPNGLAAMFTQVTASVPAALRIMEGSPPPAISRARGTVIRHCRNEKCTTPYVMPSAARMTKLMVWQIAVANEAPNMPMCSRKMNTGSNTRFSTEPVTNPIMASEARP